MRNSTKYFGDDQVCNVLIKVVQFSIHFFCRFINHSFQIVVLAESLASNCSLSLQKLQMEERNFHPISLLNGFSVRILYVIYFYLFQKGAF